MRKSKRTDAVIPKPTFDNSYATRVAGRVKGPLDTAGGEVLRKTYVGEDFVKVYKEFMAMIKDKEEKEKLLVFPK